MPEGQPTNPPLRVFYSYSHRDERLRDGLETHLKLLQRQGLIENWHDRKITAGSNLDPSISAMMEAADIILLLVSPYFIASDYCYDKEMDRAVARHETGEARVIPVILRPTDGWESTRFSNIMAVPTDGQAITIWGNRDKAWADVARGIRRAAQELHNWRARPPTKAAFIASATSRASNNNEARVIESWERMSHEERSQAAVRAAQDRDAIALWDLTESWMRTNGRVGLDVAPSTIQNYRGGLQRLLAAWHDHDLLQPPPDAAALWVRAMERQGLSSGTINGRLSAGRALYGALRWCGAVIIDPFVDVRILTDTALAEEEREPYTREEIESLLRAVVTPEDRVLTLLGAHAGLRCAECCKLRWEDINSTRKLITVRRGNRSKTRTAKMSKRLVEALNVARLAYGKQQPTYVLPYRAAATAWRRMRELCNAAGIAPKGVDGLRDAAGVRMYEQTRDVDVTARHLGISREAALAYMGRSENSVDDNIDDW